MHINFLTVAILLCAFPWAIGCCVMLGRRNRSEGDPLARRRDIIAMGSAVGLQASVTPFLLAVAEVLVEHAMPSLEGSSFVTSGEIAMMSLVFGALNCSLLLWQRKVCLEYIDREGKTYFMLKLFGVALEATLFEMLVAGNFLYRLDWWIAAVAGA